ncbi:MAG: hypothetical protein U9Q40_03155 [Campylobacterota bacterium]|nr:hypothetical protein [Campylobacterota bacterium]
MKINIGPYKNWIGPYQIAEFICFWAKNSDEEYINGEGRYKDYVHDFGSWLSGGEDKDSLLMKICTWVESKRKRKVEIKIHEYDSWSADHTLALITLPLLYQLYETKHGAPHVDDEDVPDHLKRSQYELENEWDTDPSHFDRWNWVLMKMICSFQQLVDDDWESQFHTGNIDFEFVPCNDGSGCSEMVKGPKDTSHFDIEGHKRFSAEIDEGLRLFGKYYRGLWS